MREFHWDQETVTAFNDLTPGQISALLRRYPPPQPTAPDRGGNALALPIIFAFMLLAFGAGCAVGWWAWS